MSAEEGTFQAMEQGITERRPKRVRVVRDSTGHAADRFGQAGGIGTECESTPQVAWTRELDEHLLHLRDVAQLKWGTLVTYNTFR